MLGLTFSVFLFGLMLLFFQKQKWSKPMAQYRNLLTLAFIVKVLAGLFYLWIFTYYYGDGKLINDAGAAISQSVILKNVFFQSPIDYFKLLSGIGENNELVHQYLSQTYHWSSDQMTFFNDTKNVIRLNSLFAFFSFGNPIFHSLCINFLSFLGIFQLIQVFSVFSKIRFELLFWSVFLLPNFLFWGSGILKEPIALFGIGFLINGYILKQSSLKIKLFKMGVGILFSFSFKPYIILLLILSYLFYLSVSILKRIPNYILFLGVFVLFFSSLFVLKYTQYNPLVLITNKQVDFDNIGKGGLFFVDEKSLYHLSNEQREKIFFVGDSLYVKDKVQVDKFQKKPVYRRTVSELLPSQKAYIILSNLTGSNSYYALFPIGESFLNLLYITPQGIMNTLFRPFFWDNGGVFKYMSVFETLFLFSFLIYSIFNRRVLNVKEKRILWSISLFVLILCILFGWIVCVSGAIVRYRIPIYLMILFASFIILKPSEKWKKKIE